LYGLYNIITLSAVKQKHRTSNIFQPIRLKMVRVFHQI